MGWAEKWWWTVLILAIALVIGWEEKRCQTQAYQCRASYAAQAQSDRLRGKISINQQASEQQAIAAACEPNGYFCRLFSSANLPTMLLRSFSSTWMKRTQDFVARYPGYVKTALLDKLRAGYRLSPTG
jgi:hypothetical protein